ncbi:MAG: hypothetical protein NWQ12_02700, partial [Candidatus Nanopelagicales bacterium]|nr:hypothetical protein [Candidatus Nanopelagicales bacterium]
LMRPTLAVGASAALTVSLALAYPAQAATYTPLGERSLAASSLGAGDVPRWMSHGTRPEPQRTFSRGAAAGAPGLCVDKNGDEIQGRQARQSMESRVVTRVTVDPQGSTDVVSHIFQYRTRAAAERAWSYLSATAARCEGRTEVNGEGEGITTRGVVTTEVDQTRPLFGTRGITILADIDLVIDAFDTEFDLIGDSYTAYYLAGMSIISVTFGSNDGDSRGVGRVSRGFVDTMSIVIAQRVERRTLG